LAGQTTCKSHRPQPGSESHMGREPEPVAESAPSCASDALPGCACSGQPVNSPWSTQVHQCSEPPMRSGWVPDRIVRQYHRSVNSIPSYARPRPVTMPDVAGSLMEDRQQHLPSRRSCRILQGGHAALYWYSPCGRSTLEIWPAGPWLAVRCMQQYGSDDPA